MKKQDCQTSVETALVEPRTPSVVSMQVVSVEVAGDSSKGLYLEGLSFLQEQGFLLVNPVPRRQNHIIGTAPDETTERFVVLEYVPNKRMSYFPFTLYDIDRQNKRIIDIGRIMFAPMQNGDHKVFSGLGDSMPSWEITVKRLPAKVMQKAALFKNGKRTIRTSADTTELTEAKNDIDLSVDRDMPKNIGLIARAAYKYPLFGEFVKKHCVGKDGKTTIMSVSNGLCAYLKDKNKEVKELTQELELSSPVMLYHLMALQGLHPDLQPFLEMTKAEAKKSGSKDRLIPAMGFVLSQIPLDHQVSIWNQAKTAGSHDLIILKIKGLWINLQT